MYVGAHRKRKLSTYKHAISLYSFLWDYFFFFFVILKVSFTYDIYNYKIIRMKRAYSTESVKAVINIQ